VRAVEVAALGDLNERLATVTVDGGAEEAGVAAVGAYDPAHARARGSS
jgi:hypothetical protein